MPTSRATRVTSEEKTRNRDTIELTVSLSVAISPWTSASIVLDKLRTRFSGQYPSPITPVKSRQLTLRER